jgi:hypothetical protein
MLEVVSTDAIRLQAEHDLAVAATDPNVAAELATADQERRSNAEFLIALRTAAVAAPELNGDARSVYERIRQAEQTYAAPHLRAEDYVVGTAALPDELVVVGGSTRLLTEAQHGTSTRRKKTGEIGDPDHGTSGLAAVIAFDGVSRAILPLGLQTSNANVQADHPIKTQIADHFRAIPYEEFFSIHGMPPGKASDLRDRSEIHAIIGLGLDPRDASIELAERVRAEAMARFGLRVVIGNELPHFNMTKNPNADPREFWDILPEPERNEDGTIAVGRVAAMMKNSTTTYVTGLTQDRPDVAALQFEISRSLRLMPHDRWRRDPGVEIAGVYLGYNLVHLAAELAVQRTV